MKNNAFFFACVIYLSACGGGSSKESEVETVEDSPIPFEEQNPNNEPVISDQDSEEHEEEQEPLVDIPENSDEVVDLQLDETYIDEANLQVETIEGTETVEDVAPVTIEDITFPRYTQIESANSGEYYSFVKYTSASQTYCVDNVSSEHLHLGGNTYSIQAGYGECVGLLPKPPLLSKIIDINVINPHPDVQLSETALLDVSEQGYVSVYFTAENTSNEDHCYVSATGNDYVDTEGKILEDQYISTMNVSGNLFINERKYTTHSCLKAGMEGGFFHIRELEIDIEQFDVSAIRIETLRVTTLDRGEVELPSLDFVEYRWDSKNDIVYFTFANNTGVDILANSFLYSTVFYYDDKNRLVEKGSLRLKRDDDRIIINDGDQVVLQDYFFPNEYATNMTIHLDWDVAD